MLGDSLAAELHAGVDLPLRAGELEFEAQFEVPVLLRRREEFVVRDFFRERSADQRAVFDAPGFFCVAFPAGKSLAIEKRDGCGGGEGGAGEHDEEGGEGCFHDGGRAMTNAE